MAFEDEARSVSPPGAMVFHAPYPIEGRATASGVRPPKMRDAFAELGYRVLEVTGHGAERRRRLQAVRSLMSKGLRVDFAYGENSTMPTLLTQPHHLPTYPCVDRALLRLMTTNKIATGMFYRDVYWRFPAYLEQVGKLVATGTRTLYHAELRTYRKYLDRVYLPSLKMADYVPHLDPGQVAALPPGARLIDTPKAGGPFTVLYVGNISNYYRMHKFFDAIRRTANVHAIVCTPEDSWQRVRSEYQPLMDDSIRVVHRQGDELRQLFEQADMCALAVEPAEYRDFAAPVKLYEYLGYGKPVVATAGTYAGQTVADLQVGWTVDYSVEALSALLGDLAARPEQVRSQTEAVGRERVHHSWQARAATVARDLAGANLR